MLRYGLTSGANLSRRLALAPASSALIPRAGHAQIAFKSSKALEEEESPNSSGNSKNSGKQQESRKDLPSFLGTVGGPSSSNSFSGGGGTDALKAFFEKRRATLEKEKSQLQKSEKPQPTNRRQQPQSNAGRGQANRPARSNNTAGSASDFTALRNALSRKPQPKPQQQQQQQQQGSQQRQAQPQQQQQGSQQRQAQPQQQQGSQQRPQQSQINRNNNPNPQQQQQRSSRPLPNNTTTTINRGRQNQQSYERNNGGSENNRQEIPRLADLMKHLRPDVLSQQPREQNTNRRDSMQRQEQPQWRQRRQQQQQQQQQQQRPGQDSMEQRQFQQRPSFSQRGPRQPFQRQRNDDFLQGRITRADEDDAASTAATQAALKKQDETRTITLPLDDMTLTELSILYRVKVDDIKKKLKSMGERVNDEYMLDVDMAELLAMEYGFETVRSTPRTVMDAEQILLQRRAGAEEVEESPSSSFTTEVEKPSFDSLPPRPPVVCIMGHVDHGKTTLMDALRRRSLQQQGGGGKEKKQKGGATAARSKDVAGTEAGGITQIISAFQVALEGQDSAVTFLDTPGHAAFSAMRQSGSHAADVIVLVVAADDGVSEQTIEIVNFYKSIVQGAGDSGISMIIALNKIDKPGLDVDQAKTRIENQLLEHGIITEGLNYSGSEYGLPVTVVPTSGLTGQGLDELMESLLLQSEIMDLRADDKARGEGIVMDARLEKGLGVVVDCIVRWGTIKKGDVVVSGTQLGKVRMLKDVNDGMLKQGSPSQPVRIIGFKTLPKAGDPIICVESEEAAEELVEQRAALEAANGSDRPKTSKDVEIQIPGMRSRDTVRSKRVYDIAGFTEKDGTIRIPVIIKADADGSLSAVRESLIKIGTLSKHKVVIDPVAEGIGIITANDIQMAKESDATIFAFGLKKIDQTTMNIAENEEVVIRSNDIIYSLLDEAKEIFGGYLPKVPVEHIHGKASIQAIFQIGSDTGDEKVAGLKVLDGHMYKEKAPLNSGHIKCHFRVLRNGKLISPEGESILASSLRKHKELVDSVRRGEECGLALTGFSDFKEGDVIECYSIEMKNASI